MATMARGQVNEEEFLAALYKGGELLAAGKIVDARAHLEKAHGLSPKNEKAQNLLGLTYFKLGLFDQASDIYEKLVNENPADPTLRVNLGLVYLKTNNLPRCIKEFETATDLDPEHKKAHNYLGLALAQAGDYGKAREHFILAGSDQMAEKMGRALAAKVESSPAMTVPSAPPAVAQAVTSRPAAVIPTVSTAGPPPLPPPPSEEEEIEVMSDSDEIVSGEQPMPAPPPPPEVSEEAMPPLEASEPMAIDVDVTPPPPSSPRLDRDWGAQFGMDAEPAAAAQADVAEEIDVSEASGAHEVAASADDLPVIEASADVVATPRKWATPIVNSWDAASGMTPPPPASATPVEEPLPAELPPPPPEPAMESTHDPAAEDPAWTAAREVATTAAPPPPAQDMSWNVPPDPSQEMDFGDVAPADAAPAPAGYAAESSTGQSVDQAWAEQQYTEQAPDQQYAEQPYTEQPAEQPYTEQPAEQYTEQPADQYAEQPVEQPYAEQPAEQYAEQPAEQYAEQPAEQYAEQPAEQYAEQPAEQTYAEQPVEQQYTEQYAEQPVEAYAEQPADQYAEQPPASSDSAAEQTYTGASTQLFEQPQSPTAVPPEPQEATWVAQPLSQFTPDAPPPSAPQPPPSAPGGYAPMQARTLVELGASTSDIEQPQAGPFHVGPQGLAITVNGQMLTRMTNLVAIVGSVTATPETKRSRGKATETPFGDGASQLQRLSGHGVVHLEMGNARFHALDLNDDSAYLREERVFGFEEPIGFENGTLADDDHKIRLELVHLSGDGRVLLQLNGAMKSLAIPPGEPMMVPLQRLVGWFGRVSPRLTGFAGQGAVELTGDGYALLVTPG